LNETKLFQTLGLWIWITNFFTKVPRQIPAKPKPFAVLNNLLKQRNTLGDNGKTFLQSFVVRQLSDNSSTHLTANPAPHNATCTLILTLRRWRLRRQLMARRPTGIYGAWRSERRSVVSVAAPATGAEWHWIIESL